MFISFISNGLHTHVLSFDIKQMPTNRYRIHTDSLMDFTLYMILVLCSEALYVPTKRQGSNSALFHIEFLKLQVE